MLPNQGAVEVEALHQLKRQTPVADVDVVFIGIKLDVHETYCSNTFAACQSFLLLRLTAPDFRVCDSPSLQKAVMGFGSLNGAAESRNDCRERLFLRLIGGLTPINSILKSETPPVRNWDTRFRRSCPIGFN